MFRSLIITSLLATLAVASCKFRQSSVPFVEGRHTTFPDKYACWRAFRVRHLDVIDYDRPHMNVNASIESLRKGQDEHLVGVNVVRTQRMGGSSELCEVSRCFAHEEWCTSVEDLHLRFAYIHQNSKHMEQHGFWLLRQYWFQVFMHELTPNEVRVNTTNKGKGTRQGKTNAGANVSCWEGHNVVIAAICAFVVYSNGGPVITSGCFLLVFMVYSDSWLPLALAPPL